MASELNEVLDASSEKSKRQARWTREETIVLIQAKKIIESRIQNNRFSNSPIRSEHNEPKWDAVASYCRQQDVTRTSLQCRKRWGNLIMDFRKIKAWESDIRDRAESYWMMRNELRREMRLPGLFDKDVYDELDQEDYALPAVPLAQARKMEDDENGISYVVMPFAGDGMEEWEEKKEAADGVFDGIQTNMEGPAGDFTDFEQFVQEAVEVNIPEKETVMNESPMKRAYNSPMDNSDMVKETIPSPNAGAGMASSETNKKRKLNEDKEADMGDRLVKVLERNSSLLSRHLELQNLNYQRDRDERKQHNDSLVSAISKLTDAMVQIANKL